MLEKAFARKYLPILVLLVLGLATRAAFLRYPNEVVFDEVHFGSFISAYFTHEYYFDIHPPLGKLLIAAWGKMCGYHAGLRFDNIGQAFGDASYVTLRTLPNVVGGLIPAAVYGFLGALGISGPAAFLASCFILFDNAFLVQSRFVLLDPFYLLFGFSGLWLFFRARHRGYRISNVALAFAVLGLSVSVKWIGLGFFGFAAIVMAADHIRRWRAACVRIVVSFGAPAVIYVFSFWIHFWLLSKTGPGDPFMSARFQRGLEGSVYTSDTGLKPLSLLQKTWEINRRMFAANQTLHASHPYESKFYTWPFMWRSVSYWTKDFGGGKAGYIYFLGNPVVWWLSAFAVMGGLFSVLDRWKCAREPRPAKDWLYVGYLVSLLPFAAISRLLFLYHYLAALVFGASICSALLFDEWDWRNRRQRTLWVSLLLLTISGFLFFAPLSYGWPIDSAGYRSRMWLKSWI